MSESDSKPAAEFLKMPRHVAIIMDGNNRWARQRRLPGPAGHKAGVEKVRTVLEACGDYGIEVLTLFAFSSENWQRPKLEVDALMLLFQTYLQQEIDNLIDKEIRLRVIGDRRRFSKKLLRLIEDAEQRTVQFNARTLVIAADYGGQWDITEAAKKIAAKAVEGQITLDSITPDLVDQHICLHDLPSPDLCIRTGGDHRISNFLLWQFAYSELYFTESYWPDFSTKDFETALRDYTSRQRRFGGSGDKNRA
ncbi:MAG: polyprenyl diphosphate synthase [Pseudomonadales bacterium]